MGINKRVQHNNKIRLFTEKRNKIKNYHIEDILCNKKHFADISHHIIIVEPTLLVCAKFDTFYLSMYILKK